MVGMQLQHACKDYDARLKTKKRHIAELERFGNLLSAFGEPLRKES